MTSKNYLKRLWLDLKESRKYIYAAALIFFVGSLLGFAFESKLGFLDLMINELVNKVKDLNTGQLIFYIFQNNLSSAFFAMLFGIFLGVAPVFNAIFNGVVLGYVFAKASAIDGWGVFFKILPHGVFELPAILIALGMGMKIGFSFLENFFIWYRKDALKRFFGVISLFFGLLGLVFVMASLAGFTGSVGEGNFMASSFVSLIFGIILLVPLISLLFFGSKNLKKIQKEIFLGRLYQAGRIFVFVVLPLLLIAAIIEGLLIVFYR